MRTSVNRTCLLSLLPTHHHSHAGGIARHKQEQLTTPIAAMTPEWRQQLRGGGKNNGHVQFLIVNRLGIHYVQTYSGISDATNSFKRFGSQDGIIEYLISEYRSRQLLLRKTKVELKAATNLRVLSSSVSQ